MMHAELEGVVCSGPRRDKQFTYALLEERVPPAKEVDRDEGLAELARRYFTSHGPATLRDFVWWSGLTMRDVREGVALNGSRLTDETLERSIQPKGGGDPRPQILADNLMWVRDAERRADRLFDVRPKAPVEVRREPPFSEKTAQAHYNNPAPDGSRPGVFLLPLPGPAFELLRTRSLAYHEAVPGHHFQIALQQESSELPRFRRAAVFGDITAYVEGWGLYAERLADEDGWYADDPRGRIGYLNNMLWRAVGWSSIPACTQRVELREKAKARLGANFSIKAFHNAVLRTGSVPLPVLEAEVERALR